MDALSRARLEPFLDSRFGISFHWGIYSLLQRGEWVRSIEKLSVEDYRPFLEQFTADAYRPKEWAELVKASGAKYGVLTAKHHDGFCLWDTETTEYKVTNTPAGRDLIREYVDAFREAGLRVGLYYSLVDWHHPDYPHFGDRQHPMRFNPEWKDATHNWENYRSVMHRQIEELLTQFGPLDQMVFDFSYWEFEGEKWGATKIVEMIRRHQPQMVFNDRLGGDIKGSPLPWVGDYDSPELNIPRTPPVNSAKERVPFEVWCPLNNSWGYHAGDHQYKTAKDVILALVNSVSKGGNLLLNLSPLPDGSIDDLSAGILTEVGDWLSANGEAVFGAKDADLPKPEWGWWTRRGKYLYAHLTQPTLGNIHLPGLRGKVKNGVVLKTGGEAPIVDFWNIPVQHFDEPEDIFFNIGYPTSGSLTRPDPINTVVRFEVTSEAEEREIIAQFRARKESLSGREPFA
ncbi:MAG: alpha-L-fucosidase [Fimbriimonadaceae bacterium]|jgi:alpha-L-fucosidase|nr:alpha-L-fucosidase [Fimbriimonadaceae bacterium]